MMIELEPSFWNITGRRNDKSARGHEMARSRVGSHFNSALGKIVVKLGFDFTIAIA